MTASDNPNIMSASQAETQQTFRMVDARTPATAKKRGGGCGCGGCGCGGNKAKAASADSDLTANDTTAKEVETPTASQ